MLSSELLFGMGHAGLVLLLGLGGWYVAGRCRVPAGAVIGPMLVVAAGTCLGVPAFHFPWGIQVAVQAIIGGYLGLKVDRATVVSTKPMALPIVVSTFWFVLSTLLIGYGLARWSGIDLYTALLGATPGGIAEMTALAVSAQADVALVATLQTVRLIASNVAIPVLARRRADGGAVMHRTIAAPAVSPTTAPGAAGLGCVLVALGAGYAFDAMGVPAGGIVGAMVVVAAVQLAGVRFAVLPAFWREGALVAMGIFIGGTFDAQTLRVLLSSFAVVVGVTLATLASSYILALVVQRWLRLDMQTALLACAPGGLSQMPVLADELGGQPFVVGLFQLARVVCVILLMPVLFGVLL